MGGFGWVLAGLVGWTAIGTVGTALVWAMGERRRAMRSVGWIIGAWVIYLAILGVVSGVQRQRVLGTGQEECFGRVCFAVVGPSSVGEFRGRGGGRLVQVGVRVRNEGAEFGGVEGLRAYLVDGSGRRWERTPGVGGVALTVRLPPGGAAVSEPVFRVEGKAEGLGLVLTRGYQGWGWLVIGDTDSLWHRRTVLRLE